MGGQFFTDCSNVPEDLAREIFPGTSLRETYQLNLGESAGSFESGDTILPFQGAY